MRPSEAEPYRIVIFSKDNNSTLNDEVNGGLLDFEANSGMCLNIFE